MAGISLAPADHAMAATPTWERIDLNYNVRSWQIDRGRQNEMSRTGTGTATVELVDKTGDFDPTNTTGHFFGRLDGGQPMGPLVQAKIELQNPVDSTWSTLFRGFISRIQWSPYQTEQFANVTLELVDAMAVLAAAEMQDNAYTLWGDDFVDGNIVFNEDTNLDAVQTRIEKVLSQMGWPLTLTSIFTGNVSLQKTVYAPRSTVLQVITDACDAEWPDIANVYVSGPVHTVDGTNDIAPGSVVFHGRFARFNPLDAHYGIKRFALGDDAANAADPTNIVRVSPPLDAFIDDTLIYTSALATPQNINDADLNGQYVQDAAGVATKGLRTWSAENLATLGGSGPTTALVETKKFASYYINNNFKFPQVRVGQLTVKTRRPGSLSGPKTWALFCNVDISDIVNLKTTHKGGGGFGSGGANSDFFVEGIHYTARPGAGAYPIVELTLDVSPSGYYAVSP